MSLILSIDTSTKGCSVAIHEDAKLLSISELYHEKSSSEMLTTLVAEVTKSIKISLAEIDAFAVAKGPGSYTGLRIGVSTIKGLCYTLEKPMIAINTLEAMAHQLVGLPLHVNWLCPMIDARRMEVYCAIFDASTGQEIQTTDAKIIDNESFMAELAENKILFFGDGAAKCKTVLGSNTNASFSENVIHPTAKTLGSLAFQKYIQQDFEEVADFEPFYLKEFFVTSPKKTNPIA